MELRILGELQILGTGGPLELGPLKQRLVLAALAVDAGRCVPPEVLIDRVWDSSASTDARGVLYTYITRIRRLLSTADTVGAAPITLARRPAGYLLGTPDGRFDLHRLRTLTEQAHELEPNDPQRVRLLREAIDLWRGDPLDGLPGDWAARVREGLRQQLLGVLLDWADSELRQGRPGPVADRLGQALERNPLAEPVVLHLMRALHLNGRRAEALDQYARTRTLLANELGVDPGIELQKLHQQILRDELPPRPPVASVEPMAPPVQIQAPVPPPVDEPGPWENDDDVPGPGGPGCQLPPALPDHTGCETEIAQALALLAGAERSPAPRPPLILAGPGGIGKTSLSIQLAHLLRDSYPDGQIFVGLEGRRGDPAGALNQVLRALGVSNVQQLRTLEEKLGQYRATLSGRRILIVLDSAVSAEEVLPLVPGAGGSALIASSRARLTTIPGAHHLEMRMFRGDQSLALLSRIIGSQRLAAEPEAAATVVEMCAGLPLALRIAGARLAARPHRRISRLADRLRDERGRLDELSTDGLAVRASIAVGYQGLSPAAQRVFRLLGFMDSPSFADWLAAALTGETVDATEELLEQLADARLVEVAQGPAYGVVRYHMHDLVRLYAQERAIREDTNEVLHLAVARMLRAATELCERLGERLPHAVPPLYRQPPIPVSLESYVLAADHLRPGWLDAEGPCLVAAVERAADLGMDVAACALADALVFASFAVRNDFVGWDRTHAAALGAARKAGNRVAQAVIECGIALLRYKEDRFAEAERYFPSAIALFDEAGHQLGAAAARNGLGSVLREVGRHREAIPLLEAAAVALARHGDEDGAAHALYGLGHCHRERGDDSRSIDSLQQAIDRYRSLGHWRGEAIATRGIGLVYRAAGNLDAAELWCSRAHDMVVSREDEHLACYTSQALAKIWLRRGEGDRALEPLERALATCQRLHDRLGAALVQRTIGEAHLAVGELDAAHDTLRLAYDAWRELDHDLGQARTLRDLGAVHALRGDPVAAHAVWAEARSTFQRLGTRESAEADGWHLRWNCPCDGATVDPDDRSSLAGVA
ncbi:DNA-binding SARP family transcriptional activator [Micromonospora pisi]|uniref:DNA-binding SARP family transcriptional activator n=1 Tax=Micromonospora pisi TaxID=589240 RepID=A0A495JXA6_9ACTN|nr:BTAD domain-containing putative transcriptional regulator [Micromonospora pisi]RKR92992.1 DNA-binding SARP family transcriptional activator [Micromonospora pisi]